MDTHRFFCEGYRMKTIVLMALVWLGMATVPAAEWETDFEKAREKAKKENKLLLLDFTGSDWCAACKKLKKEVFSTQEFSDYAAKQFVLVEVDFPMVKKLPEAQLKANEALEKRYEVEGYPTVVIADADGKKLGMQEGYPGGGPKAYLKLLEEIVAARTDR